ncbi:MAG: hypothetical protein EOP02_19115 [Proteobacteria bacterium]|nr:MAG: hypothetical protein EOP02_19115 [Pseudomonadota bacterium]
MLVAVISIASTLFVLPSFAISSLVGVGVFTFVRKRQRMRTEVFVRDNFIAPSTDEMHSINAVMTIESAEHQLGLVCRRMRAYLLDSYDFGRSRIRDDAGFEHSLDLAVSLSIRISDLGGEAIAGGEKIREQVRQQILEGLVNRVNLRQPRGPVPNPSHSFRDVLRS